MKKSPNFQEFFATDNVEKVNRMKEVMKVDLTFEIVDNLICPVCKENLSAHSDCTIRCMNFSCSEFLNIVAGSQLEFDF